MNFQQPNRTIAELKEFIACRDYYVDLGYPRDIAEQYAWDCIYAARKGAKV